MQVDLYLRKSNADAGRSVDRQQAELTDAASGHNLTIGRVFVDPDFSASRYAKRARPDYAQLLDHIRSGNCQALGLYEASRGSRDLTEWSALLDLCRKRGVKVWISTHGRIYDLSVRRDWRTLANEGVDAADESERISERVLSGKRKAAREGTPAGRLPYGFTRIYSGSGKLVDQTEHPDEAPIVREIIQRIVNGDSLRSISADFNERGVPAPQRGIWYPATVRRLALNPAYVAIRVHQGERFGAAAWKPIVDQVTWEKAEMILNTPGRAINNSTSLSHWLSGAVLCGACRKAKLMARPRSGGCFQVYACRNCNGIHVSASGLEATVQATLLGWLSQPEALQAFQPVADSRELRMAQQNLDTLTARLDSHYTEAAAGRLSAKGLSVVEGHLLPQISQLQAKVKRLSMPVALVDLDGIDVIDHWEGLPAGKRRDIVRAVVELVVSPATRRGRKFDPTRLDESRWIGDPMTWGERRAIQ